MAEMYIADGNKMDKETTTKSQIKVENEKWKKTHNAA